MSYGVAFAPSAVRQLRALDVPARRRIQAAVELLAEHPRPPGAVQLVGGAGEWRVRTGNHRIVYDIEKGRVLVLTVAQLIPGNGAQRRTFGFLRGSVPESFFEPLPDAEWP